ncbi:MAG: hypothetical protein FJ160_00555 [Gammaproteobacteria bacterium]|nr:hypothetical protein [Gammaproteobacteria bacterium]
MDDHAIGEHIYHVDGMWIEECEYMLASKLHKNMVKIHFNQHFEREGRFGKRIVHGGHVISIARSLSFSGARECADGGGYPRWQTCRTDFRR